MCTALGDWRVAAFSDKLDMITRRACSSTDRALASGARDRGSIPLGRTNERAPAVAEAAAGSR